MQHRPDVATWLHVANGALATEVPTIKGENAAKASVTNGRADTANDLGVAVQEVVCNFKAVATLPSIEQNSTLADNLEHGEDGLKQSVRGDKSRNNRESYVPKLREPTARRDLLRKMPGSSVVLL